METPEGNYTIKSVDPTTPMGALVLEYGERKYWEGYNAGYYNGQAAGVITGWASACTIAIGLMLIAIRR